MSTHEFKVGDVVELLPDIYTEEPWNPLNTQGVITENLKFGTHYLRVQWETGPSNSYSSSDLKLCQSGPVPADLSHLYEKTGIEQYNTHHHTIRKAHRVSSLSGTRHIIIEDGSRSISINPKELPNVIAALAEFL